ncbi:hypothetical protein ACN38_g11845 [Penicillium nordicum]|uniref:Uncharacterized protein n=1 Tax=Penicillium nordicum TaxID=229535 RepID=A0A0M8NZI5_9EURO|nr:hypothetical protein ACN38_g11845 [Penicillium nordicum]
MALSTRHLRLASISPIENTLVRLPTLRPGPEARIGIRSQTRDDFCGLLFNHQSISHCTCDVHHVDLS